MGDVIQKMITELLVVARTRRVSDIYVLPQQTGYQIRLRQLGAVMTWRRVTTQLGRQLITYFKFQANMAVSENRRPQVGAMTWPGPPEPVELRFSTVGDYVGRESLVIRVIYPYHTGQMAYLDRTQPALLRQLAQRRGLLLFAGPTGSGKTTTMYTIARELAATVLTIEDPVEIKEADFIQLQVNEAAGMDYEALVKVGLRHRPDVFIIGEIRDMVTAQAAVRAALSGHLVLTTVHAQSASGAIPRLTELGVPLAQLRQVLTGSCYQRLIPRLQDGPAVLLDILAGDHLWQAAKTTTERWRRTLEEAGKEHAISMATAQKFREG
ncbi:competence type IV pilus ATPase ComGA [Levilactobacillus fuyuanensis]|uniref:Competence type IV pilus ATPase ComGA n=1 Tax=Levilactobacillus fuyuanensis TaxID=2486022 RepID=A0ABW4H639_9LACO|nr:competence type IV pilus ATPase ComGA [Levilactobacillus fuyuanensis]